MYDLLEQIKSGDLTELNAVQEDGLYNIIQHHSSYAKSLANGLLYLYQKEFPMDELYIPEMEDRMSLSRLRSQDNTVEFSVYPNPASYFIELRCSRITTQDMNIEFIEMTGRSVISTVLNVGQTQSLIDVGILAPGAYHVRISDASGIWYSVPLIICR